MEIYYVCFSAWENLSDKAKQVLEPYREEYANALFKYCMVSYISTCTLIILLLLLSNIFLSPLIYPNKITGKAWPGRRSIDLLIAFSHSGHAHEPGQSNFIGMICSVEKLLRPLNEYPFWF